MIIPAPLNKGDTIALVCPTLRLSTAEINAAIKFFSGHGFNLFVHPNCTAEWGDFAGTDLQRKQAIIDCFNNADIKAIISARGFYGSGRLLSLLTENDISIIKRNPKIFIGFSDINYWLHYLTQIIGLQTYHGPVCKMLLDPQLSPQTIDDFFAVLMHTHKLPTRSLSGIVLTPGQVTGRLVAGNIAILQTLIGTQSDWFQPGDILFLEETADEIDTVERNLIQLQQLGRLSQAAAIVFNDMHGVTAAKYNYPDSFTDIYRRLIPSHIPLAINVPFGHGQHMLTLPVGQTVQLQLETTHKINLAAA